MENQSAGKAPAVAVGIQECPDIQHICIIGRNLFQNHLLTIFLEREMAAPCPITVCPDWEFQEGAPDHTVQPLALWDCYGITPEELWTKLGLGAGPDPRRYPVVLFNVDLEPGSDFELRAIERSVRGVFYLSEPPERLAKGIESILNGELWYSRKTTSRLLMDPQWFRPRDGVVEAMLTAREREILVAIASGDTNSEIAETCNISLHTVKTHIYNLYKKINVHNRLEATFWAARYL